MLVLSFLGFWGGDLEKKQIAESTFGLYFQHKVKVYDLMNDHGKFIATNERYACVVVSDP
jgi:hypothetical protein